MAENKLTKPACVESNDEPVMHTLDLTLKMCADSRGDECPFNLTVEHKIPEHHIHFKANLCTYNHVG